MTVNAAVRHYRSLLDVEAAPKLPMAKPLTYAELYPNAPEIPKPMATLRNPFDRQPPRVSGSNMLYRDL